MPDLKTLSDAELNALFDETERQIDALIDNYAPDYNIPDEVNNRIDEMEALTNRIITERDHRYRLLKKRPRPKSIRPSGNENSSTASNRPMAWGKLAKSRASSVMSWNESIAKTLTAIQTIAVMSNSVSFSTMGLFISSALKLPISLSSSCPALISYRRKSYSVEPVYKSIPGCKRI